MPTFAPAPINDFAEYIDRYFAECRARFPRIECVAGKWKFEDLIPGMSDFDTRFIVQDGMTVKDWCDMSAAVGQVHLDLCRREPHWARNLEHLPGVNLCWSELADPASWYPEYAQWSYYKSTDPTALEAAQAYLTRRVWGENDEYFHLKKFCLYYGRYDRRIDPAINLGPFESKYPLHSRFMHYFCPPLQSALCLIERRPICGKMESVRLARRLFPKEPVYAEMEQVIARHYEVRELYEEPELSRLEDRLESALARLKEAVAERVTLIPEARNAGIAQWREALKRVRIDPALVIFDNAKFSRLMKGRLTFYGSAPAHFDTAWVIENELRRMRQNFFVVPFGVFWRLHAREEVKEPLEVLPRLCPQFLTAEEVRCTQELNRLLMGPRPVERLRPIALELAAVFDGFFSALCKVAAAARTLSKGARP